MRTFDDVTRNIGAVSARIAQGHVTTPSILISGPIDDEPVSEPELQMLRQLRC